MPRKNTATLELEDTTTQSERPCAGPLDIPRVQRTRAADQLFETLSRAILTGELEPGSTLPPQRELARRFGVSTLIVREAAHRLSEYGLITLRQGSTTIVADPNKSADPQLMQLRLELSSSSDRLALAAYESQALWALPVLALAERRITEAELDDLERLVEALPEPLSFHDSLVFRVEFWGRIAAAARNSVMAMQLRWWATVMEDLEHRSDQPLKPLFAISKPLYRSVLKALRRRSNASELWLQAVKYLLDWTESNKAHEIFQERSK